MTVDLGASVTVVTGGASGIGRAIAHEAARRGARIVLADLDGDGAVHAAQMLTKAGFSAWGYRLDVADAADCARLAEVVARDHGPVGLLVANAGIIRPGSSWTTPEATWRAVLDVNVMGVVNTLVGFLPKVLGHGGPGHVVITASVAGLTGSPGFAAYGASKHAVVGLAKGLRVELVEAEAARVGVSVLCPGGVATDIWHNAGHASEDLDDVARRRFAVVAGVRDDQADPSAIAALTLDAVEAGRFWVVPIEQHHRDELERLDRAAEANAARDGQLVFGR